MAPLEADDVEPFFSSRPTRRDVSVPTDPPLTSARREVGPRGQFSIAAVRGVPADSVSGTIEVSDRKRRRTTKSPVDEVHLVSSTKKQVTLVVQGKSITLDRQPAIQLASLIFQAFGVSSD